ncbi:MAG TPA: EAL domain-containing protein [Arenimonas sp.]|nr:EAL domain-containing protein [Arenimonas sp.]
MKILIAEDDATIRTNLVRTLRLEGYEVTSAENGLEALRMAKETVPELVLSDVMMPELDGHGLLAALRGDPRTASVPFVFLTARADRSDVREGMKLGADDYLTKPFQRDELLDMVRTQLNRAVTRQEETRRLRQETQRLRQFDPVTDLPNRIGFEERLEIAVGKAERHGGRLAVASITIGGLQALRQSHGARRCDEALHVLADRIFAATQRHGEGGSQIDVARIGDSSFAVLVHAAGSEAVAENLVRSLLADLVAAVTLDGTDHYFLPAAGVAMFPQDGETAAMLMQNAEAAEPEPVPGGSVAFFCKETGARIGRRMQLLQAMHVALEKQQFSLCYQPQVSAEDERVVGFEALLRWEHPSLGFVSPAEFIPIAEDSGLIVPIGAWVLDVACRQMKEWLDAGFGPMRIAVNLSSRQFEDDELPNLVCETLSRTRLPPSALELEITESIAMQSAERVLRILKALKAEGVALAMDDFGTGYSSLAYLKRYPLDVLKIDQVFVRHFIEDAGDAAITRAIIALARSFNLSVVAEGVETQAHADQLAALGCHYCQGYHYSKPLPAEAVTDWLMAQRENGHD